ncbi:hypothetical protein U9M48_008091 [Paspalum notatum var. saurae]|uniref:Uncharacterized protein n=1 Tax=Paspalum notatum var. saurae TaxID=547442 RepID=A0AAQ3SPA3_PASNO
MGPRRRGLAEPSGSRRREIMRDAPPRRTGPHASCPDLAPPLTEERAAPVGAAEVQPSSQRAPSFHASRVAASPPTLSVSASPSAVCLAAIRTEYIGHLHYTYDMAPSPADRSPPSLAQPRPRSCSSGKDARASMALPMGFSSVPIGKFIPNEYMYSDASAGGMDSPVVHGAIVKRKITLHLSNPFTC